MVHEFGALVVNSWKVLCCDGSWWRSMSRTEDCDDVDVALALAPKESVKITRSRSSAKTMVMEFRIPREHYISTTRTRTSKNLEWFIACCAALDALRFYLLSLVRQIHARILGYRKMRLETLTTTRTMELTLDSRLSKPNWRDTTQRRHTCFLPVCLKISKSIAYRH